MAVLYHTEDVSFCDKFLEPVTIPVLKGNQGVCIRFEGSVLLAHRLQSSILDCFGGLSRGEFKRLHSSIHNELKGASPSGLTGHPSDSS